MASTALQMILPVIRELGEDEKDAQIEHQFVNWVADALSELNNETSDWRFLHGVQSFSTASGAANYTLGTLVADVKAVVRNTNNLTLPLITEKELGSRGFNINESGAPTNYMITTWSATNGPTIRLWPVPTSTETITVYRSTDPAAITSTTTLEVPNAAFFVLRDHVRSNYWAAAERTDLYDRYRRKYDVGVGNLRKKYAYQQNQRFVLESRDIPRNEITFRDAQLPGDFSRG